MAEHEPQDRPASMPGANEGEVAQFPSADDTRPEEEKKNQPHYLGDKVDEAVHRMEEKGEPMSDAAQRLVEEGKAAIDEAAK